MTITASLVNELRQKTGAGMMDCKNALVEADGDMQKAIDVLRKKDRELQKRELIVIQAKVQQLQKSMQTLQKVLQLF